VISSITSALLRTSQLSNLHNTSFFTTTQPTTYSMRRYLLVVLTVWVVAIVALAAPTLVAASGSESISTNTTKLTVDYGSGNITAVELGSDWRSSGGKFPTSGWLSCDTSWASPTFTEVDYLIAKVASNTGWKDCTQNNAFGSMCTKLSSYYGGAISFCGKFDFTLPCAKVAMAAQIIRDYCSEPSKHRVGGVFKFATNADLRVAVH